MTTVRRIWSLFPPRERKRVSALLALILLTSVMEAFAVAAIYPFLLVAADPESAVASDRLAALHRLLDSPAPQEFLIILGVGILLLVLATNALGALTMWFQQRFIWSFEHSLAVRLLRRYLGMPYPYFLRRNSSEMHKALMRECREICSGTLEPGFDVVSRAVVVLSIAAVLLALQPVVGLVSAVVLGGTYAVLYGAGQRWLGRAGQRCQEANVRAAKALTEAFAAIKYVKVSSRERYFLGLFDRAQGEGDREYVKGVLFARLPRYAIEGVAFALIMILFLTSLATGSDLAGLLPVLGLFAFAALRLLPALQGVVSSASRLRFNDAVLSSVSRDLGREDEAPTGEAPEPLAFEHELRLEDVRFTYEGTRREVLHDVSFVVPKNTSVGIAGKTGAGKTTLLDLLLGLLSPTSGTLSVDGRPLAGDDLARWRNNVGYVPQQIVLLDDTITRNIAFGVPDEEIDTARVEAAARVAHIHDLVVDELPDGYDTRVGERGVRLSGGQRQRLGIARALYHDPEVIVLDEATSEVDTVTERHINEALEALAGRKTVIVVAHRFSAIRNCSQVVMLEDGRVAASGTFDELVRGNPSFRVMAGA